MPTSKRLSYSMCSLPRSVCTMGAWSAPAMAMSSACAPAQPAPARMVTFFPLSSRAASWASRGPAGRTSGCSSGGASTNGCVSGASRSATSPGKEMTETPRFATALRMASSSTRGIWLA